MKNTGRRFIAASVLVLTLLSVMIPVLNAKPEQVLGANQIYVEGLGKLTYMGSHGGQDAYMDENRNMIIQGSFHHNPNATLSYHTSDYFLTVDKTYGTPKNQKCVPVPVTPYGEDKVVGNEIICSFIIRRSDLERALDELYGDGAANERALTPYISSRFILKKRNNPGEEWRYDYSKYYDSKADILKAANWSGETVQTFESCYDTQLTFNFVKYNITIKTNPAEGGTAWCDKDDNKAYGGEDVKLYANPNKNYKFRGWTVESGGMSITNAGSAVDAGFNMPNMNVVVRANFEYVAPPPTIKPIATPTPKPPVVVPPGVIVPPTATPIPVYTVTINYNSNCGTAYSSTEACYAGETVYLYANAYEGYDFGGWTVTQGGTLTGLNRTSAETSFVMPKGNVVINAGFSERYFPPENIDYYYRDIYYYTTDAGYTMKQIYGNDGALAVGSDSITNSYYTRLDTYYDIYWESNNTAWYYIPSGTKALYVHPYVYKGYYVDTESIKYITELTFPETLGPYTVTSIGGGTNKYRTRDSIRSVSGYPIEVGTFDKNGSYSYYDYYGYTESNPYYHYSCTSRHNAQYHYGVVGNGDITSKNTINHSYSSGGKSTHEYREEEKSYYVYNTTLKSVTIPSTVTMIEDYAFYNCQALEEVKGGENVTGIGKYAFACAETRDYIISEYKTGTYLPEYYAYNYYKNANYYYNDSTSKNVPTAAMIKWKESVKVPDYCAMASFPRLGVIGNYSFFLRNNLKSVVLSSSVYQINQNAFAGCELESIEIPRADITIENGFDYIGINRVSCNYGAAATLGTKGAVEDKTQIITVPESNAMSYGLEHDNYYALRAGHKITYHKNAAPAETYCSTAMLRIVAEGYVFTDTIYDNMFTPPAGMKFLGWTTNADGSGAKYYPGDILNVTAPLNLYAQWGPSTKTIKYLPNGGTGYMAEDVYQTAAAMEIVTLKANTFTRRGYEFAGWSLAPNPGVTDTIFWDKSKIALTVETLTLYAQWTPITYTVKVGTDDYRNTTQGFATYTMQLDKELSLGIKAAKTYTVNYDINKDISMSTQPFYVTVPTTEHTRASLAFSGWRLYEDTNGDGKITLPEDKHLDTFRANTTVKNLTSKKDVTLYIFPYWGGSASYVKLPEITCTGYDLIGYTSGTAYAPDTFATEAQLSNAVKSNILVMAPVGSGAKYQPKTNGENLYAYYRPKDYKVELVVDIPGAKPGDIIQNQSAVTMTFDEIIPNVQPPESSHYIFFGYYTEPGGKGRKYYDERGIGLKEWKEEEESVTKLYAHMISEVTVKLCGRGATKQEQMSVVMTYDKTGPDVIPPEKTGYKFKGYYTKTRGNGTKYFDENGKGATVWTETDVDTLYACWEQNPVELPDKDATGVPEAEPGERVQIRAERKESEVEIYADDYNALTDAYTDAGPYLVSDIVSDGRLEAAGGIPSVENVAMRAKTGAWMFFCTLEKKSGIDMIPAYVTVPYRIQYENSEDESLVISEVRSETVTVMVPKAWSYWIVEEGGLYYPEKVFVENEALKDKREELFVAWDTEDAVKKPSYQRGIYGEKEEHLAWRHVDGNGMPCLEIWIDKEQYIISNVPDTEPEVEDYLSVVAYNAAWADKTQFEARSDLLAVDGIAVLSDAWSGEGNGAAPDTEGVDKIRQAIPETVYSQIYKGGISLAVTAKNGRYESKAVVKYVAAEKNEGRNIEQAVTWVNEINIHTPVVCIPELCAKHDGMYQCEELPEESTVLVLDEEGVHSDFTLHISNTGYHCDKQGYGTRSYTKYLAVKAGTEQNEVNFPFDVWMDVGNDKEKENDVLLDKETWYTLGTETQRFYVPFWTTEGVYDIKVRSVAVNVTADADKTERLRNSVTEHYVAVNQVQVYITGRLYDFTVYNVSGTSAWKEAGEGAVYTVGVKNKEQDSRTTLPLRTGVHPKYRNAGGLPAGGSFSFRLKSVGSFFENGTKLTIYPIFLLLTKEGRIPADVYFEEETDRGVFLKKWNHTEYACQLFAETDSVAGKDTALRDWYGTFSLPDALYIAEYGTDVLGYQKRYGLSFTEEFWIYEERLLLQFEIRIENKKGEVLYYGKIPERIKNNIWCTEAGAGERADSAGMRYEIRGGEVAVIYPGESAAGDYTVHGIY
ncbi:MAG: leucine-rich repeat protein [Lachnospiraceae bacterium]|nr:leucine-rich repeat protein [Lachnospiraceae bacterium]